MIQAANFIGGKFCQSVMSWWLPSFPVLLGSVVRLGRQIDPTEKSNSTISESNLPQSVEDLGNTSRICRTKMPDY